MPRLQVVLLALAALMSLFFGMRYLRTREFMPYHAVVAGKPWLELDAGVREIILGMLKIIGGCFTAYGFTLLWLLVPLGRDESWSVWATLSITLAALAPTLYVTINLRRFEPKAPTPVAPAAIVLILVLLGLGSGLFV